MSSPSVMWQPSNELVNTTTANRTPWPPHNITTTTTQHHHDIINWKRDSKLPHRCQPRGNQMMNDDNVVVHCCCSYYYRMVSTPSFIPNHFTNGDRTMATTMATTPHHGHEQGQWPRRHHDTVASAWQWTTMTRLTNMMTRLKIQQQWKGATQRQTVTSVAVRHWPLFCETPPLPPFSFLTPISGRRWTMTSVIVCFPAHPLYSMF